MKILIVEEALKDLHGHWFQYISDLVSGGQEAGHEIEVAVHRDAVPEILNAFSCHPILRSTVFNGKKGAGKNRRGIRRVFFHNLSLYRDLGSFLSEGRTYDAVVATTTRLDHLAAYGLLSWRLKNHGFKKLVLIFVESVGSYHADHPQICFSVRTLPLRWMLKLFRVFSSKRNVFFVTESEGLSRQYEKLSGIKFSLVPHVTSMPRGVSGKALSSDDGRLVLGTYGFSRFDKGLDVLQGAIKILRMRDDKLNVHFILQWTGDYVLPNGVLVRQESFSAQNDNPSVNYIPAFSKSGEYYDWIKRTNIMVLPYRKDFYLDKLSRVAIDAALAGMPFVFPVGTWLESFAREYGAGISFSAGNPASLASAIEKAVAGYDNLKSAADARKERAREAFSARTFFDIIADLPNVRHSLVPIL